MRRYDESSLDDIEVCFSLCGGEVQEDLNCIYNIVTSTRLPYQHNKTKKILLKSEQYS